MRAWNGIPISHLQIHLIGKDWREVAFAHAQSTVQVKAIYLFKIVLQKTLKSSAKFSRGPSNSGKKQNCFVCGREARILGLYWRWWTRLEGAFVCSLASTLPIKEEVSLNRCPAWGTPSVDLGLSSQIARQIYAKLNLFVIEKETFCSLS